MNEENRLDVPKMWQIYKDLLLSTKRKNIDKLVEYLDNSDFKYAPASTRYHNCIEGGLLAHSLNVYNECMRQKGLIKLFNVPLESIILTSLLHDICKVNYYTIEMRNVKVNGTWVQEPFYKVDDLFPMGHAEKSIMMILMNGIQLTEVEIAMIRAHMGGFVSDNYFSPSAVFNKYPEAIILHNADMIATYILESDGMLESFRENLKEYVEN